MNEETAELIRSLKETIRAQANEMESLQEQLAKMSKEREQQVGCVKPVGKCLYASRWRRMLPNWRS